MSSKYKGLIIDKTDNVATALGDLPSGEEVSIMGEGMNFSIHLKEEIPFGFKFATKTIAKGQPVIKYGESIGEATEDIGSGSLVHIHNLVGTRGRGDLANNH